MRVAALLLACAVLAALAPAPAFASEPHLRVIVPEAAVRAGPGDRFREVYRAERGEVFPIAERATLGYWFRVVLPDGTSGWIPGDLTMPVEVDVGAQGGSRAWARLRGALFGPSPILRSHAGFAFSAGAVGGDGSFLFRPSLVIDDHFALEGHVGEAVGTDGSLLLYGLSAEILMWPMGPLVPFFCLGGGGATSFPKVNGVTQSPASQLALDAGGGALLIIRPRLVLRFDVRNYTLFTANRTTNRQEYSGGLAVYF